MKQRAYKGRFETWETCGDVERDDAIELALWEWYENDDLNEGDVIDVEIGFAEFSSPEKWMPDGFELIKMIEDRSFEYIYGAVDATYGDVDGLREDLGYIFEDGERPYSKIPFLARGEMEAEAKKKAVEYDRRLTELTNQMKRVMKEWCQKYGYESKWWYMTDCEAVSVKIISCDDSGMVWEEIKD